MASLLKTSASTSRSSTAHTNSTANSQTLLPSQPLKGVRRRRCNLLKFLESGMPPNSRPNLSIVLRLLGIFIGFAVLLSIAGKLPVKPMWVAVIIIGSLCTIGNTIDYAFSARSHRELPTDLCIDITSSTGLTSAQELIPTSQISGTRSQ
jgi:hypothetical protein